MPQVWPLACSTSPPLLCFFCSSTHSQIGRLCPVIKGLSQCKLLLFNRNIPTTSFLQAHISLASLSDRRAPGNSSPHSLSYLLEPERFSPKAATAPSTGKIRSSCDGRRAEHPGSEVLGGLQQLGICFESALICSLMLGCRSRSVQEMKGRDATGQK